MKITTLPGSPGKKGNTATVLACFEQRAAKDHTLKGKTTALLVTCAGFEEKNADLVGEIFKREMEYPGHKHRILQL